MLGSIIIISFLNLSLASFSLCPLQSGPSFGIEVGQWNYQNFSAWSQLQNSSQCGGNNQSPINILTISATASSNQVIMEYSDNTNLTVEDLSSTLEAVGDYSHLQLQELSGNNSQAIYISKQFHIHIPSEHLIDSQSYPLEVHFVHVAEQQYCSVLTNKVTVIGVLFEVDQTSNITFFKDWDTAQNDSTLSNFSLVSSILQNIPSNASYYSYSGSLTTPPCLETVNWLVLSQPLKIKQEDLSLLQTYFIQTDSGFQNNQSNRTVQALNNRIVSKKSITMSSVSNSTFSTLSSLSVYNVATNSGLLIQLMVIFQSLLLLYS